MYIHDKRYVHKTCYQATICIYMIKGQYVHKTCYQATIWVSLICALVTMRFNGLDPPDCVVSRSDCIYTRLGRCLTEYIIDTELKCHKYLLKKIFSHWTIFWCHKWNKDNNWYFSFMWNQFSLPDYSPWVTNATPCMAIMFKLFFKTTCMPSRGHAHCLASGLHICLENIWAHVFCPVLRNQMIGRAGQTWWSEVFR